MKDKVITNIEDVRVGDIIHFKNSKAYVTCIGTLKRDIRIQTSCEWGISKSNFSDHKITRPAPNYEIGSVCGTLLAYNGGTPYSIGFLYNKEDEATEDHIIDTIDQLLCLLDWVRDKNK